MSELADERNGRTPLYFYAVLIGVSVLAMAFVHFVMFDIVTPAVMDSLGRVPGILTLSAMLFATVLGPAFLAVAVLSLIGRRNGVCRLRDET